MAGRGVAAGYLAHALRLDGQPQIPTLEEVMKVSLKALEHYGSVVAMLAFAFMTYSDYSRDGDLINLGLSAVLTVLASLPPTFTPSIKGKRTRMNKPKIYSSVLAVVTTILL